MCWYNRLGDGLQVVGLLGAIYLLARLHENVTGRQITFLRRIRMACRRLRALMLRLLGRDPGPVEDKVHLKLSGKFEFVGRAHGVTARGPMPDGLALDAQVAWIGDHVRAVERKHNDLSSKVWHLANAQEDAVKANRDHAENEIRQAVKDVRSEVRELVGNDVRWEILYLAAAAVGVVLAALPC